MFYAGFIEFGTKRQIDNSAFAMLKSRVCPSLLSPYLVFSTNISDFVVKIVSEFVHCLSRLVILFLCANCVPSLPNPAKLNETLMN